MAAMVGFVVCAKASLGMADNVSAQAQTLSKGRKRWKKNEIMRKGACGGPCRGRACPETRPTHPLIHRDSPRMGGPKRAPFWETSGCPRQAGVVRPSFRQSDD